MKILKIILKFSFLIGNFLATLPFLYFRHRQGAKAFTRELIKSGIDKEKARELTKEYKRYPFELLNRKKNKLKRADN